jgi:hypothetical protein
VGTIPSADRDVVASLLATAQAMGGRMAASGMYATALPHATAAEPQERLLALLGRRAERGREHVEPIRP